MLVKKNMFVKFCEKTSMILCAGVLLLLCIWSFSYIAFMGEAEIVSFYSIHFTSRILGVSLWAAILIALAWFAKKVGIEKQIKWIGIAFVIAQASVFLWATKAVPVADSWFCFNAAQDAANDVWNRFTIGGYLYNFPYQASLVAIEELLFRMVHNWDTVLILFRLLNLIALTVLACSFCGIAKRLFGETAAMLTSILLASSLPVALYVFFLYGNMISNALAYAAVWSIIVYFDTKRIRNAVGSILLISGAMAVKPTALIMMLAIGIIWTLVAIKRSQWNMFVGIVLMILVSTLPGKAVQYWYSERSEVPVNPGVSNLVYIAMGLDIQSENVWFAPGWYTGWSALAYQEANYDYDEMNRQQIEMLKDNFHYFAEHPQETKEFFLKKIVSQWMDPVFGVWEYISQHTESVHLQELTRTINEKSYNEGINQILGCLQATVYVMALYGVICIIKKGNLVQILPGVIFLGGFLYLVISEGKAQYSISFYPSLFPICAYGILMMKDVCVSFVGKIKRPKDKPSAFACN